MLGMDAKTGRRLEGDDHLRQSIADILTTPIGSRVLRRDYGSMLLDLIDQPANALTKLRLYAAVATALMRWEPRIRVKKISLEAGDAPGAWILELETIRNDQLVPGGFASLTIPLRFRAAEPPTVRPAFA